MNAILCCVDYGDLLSITLPYNRHHFDRVMVVTTPLDHLTKEVAIANKAEVHETEAFYAGGAHFRKYLALEEGLDKLGRQGWLAIIDADILWPKWILDLASLTYGCLYSPRRRMLTDISSITPASIPREDLWPKYPLHPQALEWAGYTQIFHGEDLVLGTPPWHDTSWIHAGGGDSFFQAKWHPAFKIRPDWQVLHLGPCGENWLGRTSPYLDGSSPANAPQRLGTLRRLLLQRRSNPSDPYHLERGPRHPRSPQNPPPNPD